MKKVLLGVLLILTVCLTGCNYADYTEISFDEMNSKFEKNDTFVLVVGSSTCSACIQYKKTMQEIIKDYKVEVFFIDINNLDENQYNDMQAKYRQYDETSGRYVIPTPTTVFIINGSESSYERLVGTARYTVVVDKLKRLGFIGD